LSFLEQRQKTKALEYKRRILVTTLSTIDPQGSVALLFF